MAINVKNGSWGLSLIQSDEGGYSCSALLNRIAPSIQAHYPPFGVGGYTFPYALVSLDGGTIANDANTLVVPRRIDIDNATWGDLNNPQRNNIRNWIESRLSGYSFTDWDSQIIVKPGFDMTLYTNATPLRQIILDLYAYLGHSDYRPKPAPVESHNTEYTDDFSVDPTARWTLELGGTPAWDSGNSELDFDAPGYAEHAYRYSANDPGSIEQEAQVTAVRSTTSTQRLAMAGVRWTSDGTNDGYGVYLQGDDVLLAAYLAGTRTTISTFTSAFAWVSASFQTQRLAASGAAGANVVLDLWYLNHGTTKPSDPGWIGVDGSPDDTYTDSGVNRHDDADDIDCGIAGRGSGGADWDTRHCFFKERAISDRGGAPADPEGSLINGKLINGGLLLHGVLIQ